MKDSYGFVVHDQEFEFVEEPLGPPPLAGEFALVRLGSKTSIFQPRKSHVARPWALLTLAGSYDFTVSGLLAKISASFAKAQVPVIVFSDYQTDYFAVPKEHLARAITQLEGDGHDVAQKEAPICEA